MVRVSRVPRGLSLSLSKGSASCEVLAQVQVTGQEKQKSIFVEIIFETRRCTSNWHIIGGGQSS